VTLKGRIEGDLMRENKAGGRQVIITAKTTEGTRTLVITQLSASEIQQVAIDRDADGRVIGSDVQVVARLADLLIG